MAYIGKTPTPAPLTSSDITDGIISIADLATTGTASSTTFLRGDGAFAEAGGGKVLRASPTAGAPASWSCRSLCPSSSIWSWKHSARHHLCRT
mgnify:CR=1 FL=1